ncbi:MAG: DUF3846 domain-containing protein [Eubacteriales bacterium]|nr:DUF3846 domain-containing protein [Eubacteriales bacterium]
MEISIYQINMKRDTNRLAFFGLEDMEELGHSKIDSSIYDKVYSCKGDFKSLEDVFQAFNLNLPPDYHDRSLSVSDIVEVKSAENIEPGFYFCDSFGFQKVDFEPTKTAELDTMRVVLVEPGKVAREARIGTRLSDLQAAVGGDIEQFCPYKDEVALICDEEGKVCGKDLNRAIYGEDGQMVDIVAGTFFVCAAPSDSGSFKGLSDAQIERYLKQFKYPQQFIRINDEIKAVKYNTEQNKNYER